MTKNRLLANLILTAVFLAACAPAEGGSSTEPAAQATQPPIAAQPTMARPEPTLEAATATIPGEEATALPAATSRGPDLHATDPTTVSLASGGLQFVEFFRFT